ncbi:hypothetical protein BH10ACT4_BH10ACT4_01520 [soil metagenome]
MKYAETTITLPDLRLWDRLPQRITTSLQGPHPWGHFEVAPLSRGLWTRERLTVYPPGTTAAERRLQGIFRNWPLIGSVAALFAMMALGVVLSPLPAFIVAFALYGASVGYGARTTSRLRAASIQLVVVRVAVDGGVSSCGNVASMAAARAAFAALDDRAAHGGLSPAQYESEWATIFLALDDCRPALAGELEEGILRSESLPGA